MKFEEIRPVNMTLERALEIATGSSGLPKVHAVFSDRGPQGRLSQAEKDLVHELWAKRVPAEAIARQIGCTDRTVHRVVRDDHERAEWLQAERRRQNLESFRRMTEDWSELAS